MTDFTPYPTGANQIVMWDPAVSGTPYSTRWDCNPSKWDAGASSWDGGASVWDAPPAGETFWFGKAS